MLGTQKTSFVRLLKSIDDLIESANINDEVIVQVGDTKYNQKHFKSIDYLEENTLNEYILKSDVIITHAGYGSIVKSISAGKKVIAVARLKKFKEMVDDHQLELINKLSKEGYILDGTHSLIEAWKALSSFTPKKYDFTNQIVKNLIIYIESNKINNSLQIK